LIQIKKIETSSIGAQRLHPWFVEVDNEIGNSVLGPVTPQDRNGQTGLIYRETDGFVPTGTRKLSFWLSMERLVSGDNDGYADNLSFVLQAPLTPIRAYPSRVGI